MPELSQSTIEGKLIAQRQLIAQLLAQSVLGPDARAAVAGELLHTSFVAEDQQEDPGAVPSEGHSIEAAIAEEKRLVMEEASRLVGEFRGTYDASEGSA